MPNGIRVSMSTGCPWQDAFKSVKIMVIVNLIVSLNSKATLPIAPVRKTVLVDAHVMTTSVKISLRQ